MKIQQAKQLQFGDEVYWNDPDNGLCSRSITIREVRIVGNMLCIYGVDGYYLECFPKELS
jgi:hypothetical protein